MPRYIINIRDIMLIIGGILNIIVGIFYGTAVTSILEGISAGSCFNGAYLFKSDMRKYGVIALIASIIISIAIIPNVLTEFEGLAMELVSIILKSLAVIPGEIKIIEVEVITEEE